MKSNQMLEITIPDRQKFLNKVLYAVTKEHYSKFFAPPSVLCDIFRKLHPEECKEYLKIYSQDSNKAVDYFEKHGLVPPVSEHLFVKYCK